jgi:dipeptidase E
MVGRLQAELRDAGLDVVPCDPAAAGAGALLAECQVLAVSGGDPFHLLARLRETGFDRCVVDAVKGGAPYIGVSAGAIVAGPTLEPIVITSPFKPAPGARLAGLGLVDRLVLPHHDRRGRAALHAEATRLFGDRVPLVPLSNGEALVVEGGESRVVRADPVAAKTARQTWKGLRADGDSPTMALADAEDLAREADADAEAREQQKWRALFASGLVNRDSVPVLQIPRESVRWASCDDAEVHVLLRVDGGASIAAMIDDGKVEEDRVIDALCRLAGQGVIRFE